MEFEQPQQLDIRSEERVDVVPMFRMERERAHIERGRPNVENYVQAVPATPRPRVADHLSGHFGDDVDILAAAEAACSVLDCGRRGRQCRRGPTERERPPGTRYQQEAFADRAVVIPCRQNAEIERPTKLVVAVGFPLSLDKVTTRCPEGQR